MIWTRPSVIAVVAVLAVTAPLFSQVTATAPAGNPVHRGAIDLSSAREQRVELPGRPEWIGAAPDNGAAAIWVRVADGRLVTLRFAPGTGVTVEDVGVGVPAPIVGVPLPAEAYVGNTTTAPVRFAGGVLTIDAAGRLRHVLGDGGATLGGPQPENGRVLANGLLPDSRIVPLSFSRMIALADPTDDYAHGVLGDRLEPQGFVIVEAGSGEDRDEERTGNGGAPPRLEVTRHRLRTYGVMETVMPLVADVHPHPGPEVLVPVSAPGEGSRVVVAAPDGEVLAEGPPIGRGFRWRHLLAAGPVGPDGETELVAVRTPHIGGSIEYYRLRGRQLEIVHTRPGYSTHRIGDRNLETALVADFTGDGRFELLLPAQREPALAVISRTAEGSREVARFELPAELTTNLAAVQLSKGRLLVVAGTADGSLLLWSER